MRFRKLAAVMILSALVLVGCATGSSESNSDETQVVYYAKVYNPDGTLLAEGNCMKPNDGNRASYQNDIVCIEIDGVTYKTSYNNIVVMSWRE